MKLRRYNICAKLEIHTLKMGLPEVL